MTSFIRFVLFAFLFKNGIGEPEPILDLLAVAEPGTLALDLLCGCGCRFVDVKTCVADTKKVCTEKVKHKCVHKEKVECKDEYHEECKTVYKDVCFCRSAWF